MDAFVELEYSLVQTLRAKKGNSLRPYNRRD